jgi:hypothetical protein
MQPIIAFHNKPEIKQFYLDRAKAHFEADEIVKGKYWEDGKGCAVGCLVHSSSHQKLAEEINIPVEMAYLIDRLFEGLPNGVSKSFPVRFLESINIGSDLSLVMDRYFLALLSDEKEGAILSANEIVRSSIKNVIDLFKRVISGDFPSQDEWQIAYRAADRAADRAAYSAAYSAADSAAYSAAYRAADRAAYRAAYSAAYSAAYRAADRAADSAAYRAADSAAHFIWQSELLLKLLAEAPVKDSQ